MEECNLYFQKQREKEREYETTYNINMYAASTKMVHCTSIPPVHYTINDFKVWLKTHESNGWPIRCHRTISNRMMNSSTVLLFPYFTELAPELKEQIALFTREASTFSALARTCRQMRTLCYGVRYLKMVDFAVNARVNLQLQFIHVNTAFTDMTFSDWIFLQEKDFEENLREIPHQDFDSSSNYGSYLPDGSKHGEHELRTVRDWMGNRESHGVDHDTSLASMVVITRYTYRCGLPHGTARRYYHSGALKQRNTFIDGRENGLRETWYDIEGEGWDRGISVDVNDGTKEDARTPLLSSVMCIDGKREGPMICYFKTGQIWTTATYRNDELHGEYVIYHENGNRSDRRFYGAECDYCERHPNTLVSKRYAHPREHGSHTRWYKNGQCESVVMYHCGNTTSHMYRWSEDGTPKEPYIYEYRCSRCHVNTSHIRDDGSIPRFFSELPANVKEKIVLFTREASTFRALALTCRQMGEICYRNQSIKMDNFNYVNKHGMEI